MLIMRQTRGFTLLEMVLVLSVIAALLAALAPVTFSYLRDAQVTQAQNDANRIAAALVKFVEHTGVPPYKNVAGTSKSQVKQANDFDCLAGSEGIDPTTTSDATSGDSWTSAAGVQCQSGSTKRDTIENHVITNTPAADSGKAYASTGRFAWRGPYLTAVPPDPWGNKYIVNVGKFDPSASKAVWVLSAGPDGIISTASDAGSTSTVSPAGDDIIGRLK